MSLRALAVLALVLAVAVTAALWVTKRPKPGEEDNAPGEPLLALSAKDVGAIEVTRAGAAFRLERKPDVGWVLTRPALEEARSEAADALLRGVVEARVRRVLEARVPPGEQAFGLAPPEAVVTLFPAKAPVVPVTLRVGGTSPVSTDRYVVDGAGRLLLVEGALAGSLDTSRESLAERHLVPAHESEIAAMRLLRPDGEVRLERDAQGWKMRAPLEDRADATDVDAWVRSLSGLEISRTLRDTEMARATTSLERPSVKVAVTLVGGRTLPEVSLASQGPLGTKDDPERYASRPSRLAGATAVSGPVAKNVLDDLLRPVDALRDPEVATFDVPAAREVRIREAGHELALVRAETGQAWTAREDGKPAAAPDPGAVAGWLDRLRLLHASAFVPPGGTFAPMRSAAVKLHDGTTVLVEVGSATGGRVPVRGSKRPGVVVWIATESLPPWPVRVADLRAAAGP